MPRDAILKSAIEPFELSADSNVNDLVSRISSVALQGGKLGHVVDNWARMLKKDRLVIWMGLAGAMVPAGMRKLVCYLLRHRMIDVMVTTGATLYHDCYESMSGRHFLGTDKTDDVLLRHYRIDRVYDVYADEKKLYRMDNVIDKEFCEELVDGYAYSTREVAQEFGRWLSKKLKDEDSISVRAYQAGVPVFVPGFADSSLGFSMMFANRRGRRIIVDNIKDVEENSEIAERTRNAGHVIVGGGAPKNFIEQTVVIARRRMGRSKNMDLGVQVTSNAHEWARGKDSVLSEARTWKKRAPRQGTITCWVDATIALPIIVQALAERTKRLARRVPLFSFSEKHVEIEFERRKLCS
jgi:deoxyhypusine synthase